MLTPFSPLPAGHFLRYHRRNISLGPLFFLKIRLLVFKFINLLGLFVLEVKPYRLDLKRLSPPVQAVFLAVVQLACVLGSFLWDHIRLMLWSAPLFSRRFTLSLWGLWWRLLFWNFWCCGLSPESCIRPACSTRECVVPGRCGAGQGFLPCWWLSLYYWLFPLLFWSFKISYNCMCPFLELFSVLLESFTESPCPGLYLEILSLCFH